MSASLAREARHPPLTGSAFVRALAALDDAPIAPAPDAFAQRLAQWLAWTDAFRLSAALGGGTPRAGVPGVGGRAALAADERELARVRAALAKTCADTLDGEVGQRRIDRPRAGAAAAPEAPIDFITLRQRYARCQRAMETQIAPLRRRLRASLAGRSPALARLAELDTVMEQVVGARERALLAGVARRLEPRFEQLRGMHGEAPIPHASGPARFRREMRGLLLAELDLRLQPVEGLLEACRKSLSDRP